MAVLAVAVDPATDYAMRVVSGAIVAGPYVRAAGQRHLDDLDRARFDDRWRAGGRETPTPLDDDGNPSRPFPYRYSWERVDDVVAFFSFLEFYEGDFAGEPFRLLDYQEFLTGSLFGWYDPDTGLRRFQNVYVEIGKGNGKTPWAAAVGLYCMMADGEEGAQVYSAASGLDQAKLCFNDAHAFASASPAISGRLIIDKTNLAYPKRRSFFRPISGTDRGKSGPRPSCAIVDEMHELKGPRVLSLLRRGFKFRKQPIFLGITNSGEGNASVCWQYHDKSVKVATGVLIDDRWLAYVCALDRPEEWVDETCWVKTMPAIGKIVPYDAVREQVKDALEVPMHQNDVKRLYFCIWTSTKALWLDMDKWAQCVVSRDRFQEILLEAAGVEPGTALVDALPAVQALRCYVGVDLSSTIALTASVTGWVLGPSGLPADDVEANPDASQVLELYRDPWLQAGAAAQERAARRPGEYVIGAEDDFDERIIDAELDIAEDRAAALEEAEAMRRLRGIGRIAIRAAFFMPADNLDERERRDQVPYLQWARDGYIAPTEGPVVDYAFLREYLDRVRLTFDPKEIGYDPYNALSLMTQLNADGWPVVQVDQTYSQLSDACKQLERAVRAGLIVIEENPVLTWHASNATTKRDPKGNVIPDKSDERNFIDGISALVTMLARLLRDPYEPEPDLTVTYIEDWF